MPQAIYLLIHLIGIFMLLLALGGAILHAMNGGTRSTNPRRREVALSHGFGMLFTLIGGFGALAKMGIHWPLPMWVILKFIIWVLLGAMLGWIYMKPQTAKLHWLITVLLAASAGYLAILKPF